MECFTEEFKDPTVYMDLNKNTLDWDYEILQDLITIEEEGIMDISNKLQQRNFDEYINSLVKDTRILPQPFARIEQNVELLDRCRPFTIKVVDCDKFKIFYNDELAENLKTREKIDHKFKKILSDKDNDISDTETVVIDLDNADDIEMEDLIKIDFQEHYLQQINDDVIVTNTNGDKSGDKVNYLNASKCNDKGISNCNINNNYNINELLNEPRRRDSNDILKACNNDNCVLTLSTQSDVSTCKSNKVITHYHPKEDRQKNMVTKNLPNKASKVKKNNNRDKVNQPKKVNLFDVNIFSNAYMAEIKGTTRNPIDSNKKSLTAVNLTQKQPLMSKINKNNSIDPLLNASKMSAKQKSQNMSEINFMKPHLQNMIKAKENSKRVKIRPIHNYGLSKQSVPYYQNPKCLENRIDANLTFSKNFNDVSHIASNCKQITKEANVLNISNGTMITNGHPTIANILQNGMPNSQENGVGRDVPTAELNPNSQHVSYHSSLYGFNNEVPQHIPTLQNRMVVSDYVSQSYFYQPHPISWNGMGYVYQEPIQNPSQTTPMLHINHINPQPCLYALPQEAVHVNAIPNSIRLPEQSQNLSNTFSMRYQNLIQCVQNNTQQTLPKVSKTTKEAEKNIQEKKHIQQGTHNNNILSSNMPHLKPNINMKLTNSSPAQYVEENIYQYCTKNTEKPTKKEVEQTKKTKEKGLQMPFSAKIPKQVEINQSPVNVVHKLIAEKEPKTEGKETKEVGREKTISSSSNLSNQIQKSSNTLIKTMRSPVMEKNQTSPKINPTSIKKEEIQSKMKKVEYVKPLSNYNIPNQKQSLNNISISTYQSPVQCVSVETPQNVNISKGAIREHGKIKIEEQKEGKLTQNSALISLCQSPKQCEKITNHKSSVVNKTIREEVCSETKEKKTTAFGKPGPLSSKVQDKSGIVTAKEVKSEKPNYDTGKTNSAQSKVAKKEYSPPVLPIPSYRQTFKMLEKVNLISKFRYKRYGDIYRHITVDQAKILSNRSITKDLEEYSISSNAD